MGDDAVAGLEKQQFMDTMAVDKKVRVLVHMHICRDAGKPPCVARVVRWDFIMPAITQDLLDLSECQNGQSGHYPHGLEK